MASITGESDSGVFIEFPLPDQRLFRNQAIEEILLLLLRNPHQKFTVTEIRNNTGQGGDTTQTAINVLQDAKIIKTQKEGRKKLVSANGNRFYNPEEPLLQIPQEQFRDPVKAFLDRIEELEIEIAGVILFGSVARGEADRASDIDLQVIVDHKLTEARRKIHEIRQDIEEQKFDGQRYKLQVLVESIESSESYKDKLQEIFSEGIKIKESDKLDKLKDLVLHGK